MELTLHENGNTDKIFANQTKLKWAYLKTANVLETKKALFVRRKVSRKPTGFCCVDLPSHLVRSKIRI